MPHHPIEPLDVRVLLSLSWLYIFKLDAPLLGPGFDGRIDVLRAVVNLDHAGLTPPGGVLPGGPDNSLRGQGKVNLNAQRLPVEVIDHIEKPETPAVLELVMHEIHGQDFIDGMRHAQSLWLVTYQPLARLDTQIELQFQIDPLDALVIPFEALDVAKVQVAQTEALIAVVVGQAPQPVGNELVVGVLLALVAKVRLADREHLTSQPDGDAALCHHLIGHLASARRSGYFLARYSEAISALRFSLMYILLRCRLSSSSSFMRESLT